MGLWRDYVGQNVHLPSLDDLVGGRFNALVLLVLVIFVRLAAAAIRHKGWRALLGAADPGPAAVRVGAALVPEAEPAEPAPAPVVDDVVEPPAEFRRKVESCAQFAAGARVLSWARFPCSLHFEGAAPSEAALDALATLSAVLGPFGREQGHYGAGGGGMHVLYLGRPDGYRTPGATEGFPPLAELVAMLRLAEGMAPPSTAWMSTLDPLHQQLFCHEPGGREPDAAAAGPPLFERLYNVISAELHTRAVVDAADGTLPPRITRRFPWLRQPRLLFVLPRFSQLHGGGCGRAECPLDDSVLDEATGGKARERGDIFEAPCHALFQLESTGEVMSIVNWDFRD